MATGENTQFATKRTFVVDLAVSSGGIGSNLIVKFGTSTAAGVNGNDVVLTGSNDEGIGITDGDCFPPVNGDTTGTRSINVVLFCPTKVLKTNADHTRGDSLVAGATGYPVSATIDTSAPGTTVPRIGRAMDASTAGTDTKVYEIEVLMTGGYIGV